MIADNKIRRRTKADRICLRCKHPLEEGAVSLYGGDPLYHMACYRDHLIELRDKHGETVCYLCEYFQSVNAEGGKGSVLAVGESWGRPNRYVHGSGPS